MNQNNKTDKPGFLAIIIPGVLVAATGIGAGDLATASFTGSQLGYTILWAVLVGGIMKYFLTEGLARWQLVSGRTFIEGVAFHFGPIVGWLFLPYLFLWSFFVGSALMSACGVTLHAIFPVFDTPEKGKIVFGILSSLIGLILVLIGGFKLFEKVMSLCIAIMFATVVITAVLLWPGTIKVLSGIFLPRIPQTAGSGITWTVALIGGVGGTLTMLCYGYWIQEKGRTGSAMIRICRLDLLTGYAVTVLFGMAMVIIGSHIKIEGRGAGLLIILADRLNEALGFYGKWLFLTGAFGAVFSSLLGVWQAIPYLFADLWYLFIRKSHSVPSAEISRSKPYYIYMAAIGIIPMTGLLVSFKEIQKMYAVAGSLFIPLLALALLILNGKRKFMPEYRNRPFTIIILVMTLFFFCAMAWIKWIS